VPKGSQAKRQRDDDESDPKFRLVLKEYDVQIGKLLDGLKQLGLEQNTIVIFTSDNGPLPTMNGARAAGLRGSKMSLYEGGVRMPFIVRWPGHTPAGKINETSLFNAVDLFPTFCALAQVEVPREHKLDGRDVSALFNGHSASHSGPMFWEYGRNNVGFHYPKGNDRSPNLAMREGDWKCLLNADGTDLELYNLARDPGEKNNVAAENSVIAEKMKKQLLAWRTTVP
jgi:arylsulfatase A-like enzyme